MRAISDAESAVAWYENRSPKAALDFIDELLDTQTTSGNVGAPVSILGTNLTGATGVSFNCTAVAFTIVLGSEIKVIVPAGATTGFVTPIPGYVGEWHVEQNLRCRDACNSALNLLVRVPS
jgi:hypothetical protein